MSETFTIYASRMPATSTLGFPVIPLCWKVRDQPVYLLASFHMGPPGGFDHGPSVMKAFDSAERIIFEMSVAEMAQMQGLAKRDKGSLKDDLGDQLYDRVLKSPSYDASQEALRLPFVILQHAAHAFSGTGLVNEWGVETMLIQRAQSNGQEVGGLETAQELVSSLTGIATERIVDGLQTILDQPDLLIESRDLLLDGYMKGDLAALTKARDKMHESYPDVANRLFSERENRWLSTLAPICTEGRPTIVVMGAAHFGGNTGILASLQHQGLLTEKLTG